jgi:hypothetical protein
MGPGGFVAWPGGRCREPRTAGPGPRALVPRGHDVNAGVAVQTRPIDIGLELPAHAVCQGRRCHGHFFAHARFAVPINNGDGHGYVLRRSTPKVFDLANDAYPRRFRARRVARNHDDPRRPLRGYGDGRPGRFRLGAGGGWGALRPLRLLGGGRHVTDLRFDVRWRSLGEVHHTAVVRPLVHDLRRGHRTRCDDEATTNDKETAPALNHGG